MAGLTTPGSRWCRVVWRASPALAIGRFMPKLTDWRFSQHDVEEIPEELED